MVNENHDMNENNINALNTQIIAKNNKINMDGNGVINLTTKTNPSAICDIRTNPSVSVSVNNGVPSNFSCKEPIVFQPQMVVPNCNFIKYDLIPEQPNGLVNANFQNLIAYNNSTIINTGNISQSDITQCYLQPAEGFQYLHFMMNNGFATADLSGNFANVNNNISTWQNFGYNNIPSVMCVEAPVEISPSSDINGNQKKKGGKPEVPPFLKRNRNKSKETGIKSGANTKEAINSTNSDSTEVRLEVVSVETEEEDDVIFIGEYKSTEDLNKTQCASKSLPNFYNSEDSLDDIPLTARLAQASANDNKKRKRSKDLNPTRRNPKRKVQIEKKSIELAMKLSEIDDFKKPTVRKSVENNQACRRSARQLAATGAIYIPPKPLSLKDFKEWPVNGMHERPEYDPVKSIIQPFDYTIRNIQETAAPTNSRGTHSKQSSTNSHSLGSSNSNSNHDFAEHDFDKHSEVNILRYVIGHVCQKKKVQLNQPVITTDKNTDIKTISFNPETSNKFLLAGCKTKKGGKKTEEPLPNEEPSEEDKQLKELLYDCCVLYCLTNNVNQRTLANYLMNFDPDVAVEWLNNQILQEVTN